MIDGIMNHSRTGAGWVLDQSYVQVYAVSYVRLLVVTNFGLEQVDVDKIPRDERLCSLCNCNKIEDKTHFLLESPRYFSIRDMFFSKIESKIPFLRINITLMSRLMNCTDYYINIQLISFISSCFELRDKLVL